MASIQKRPNGKYRARYRDPEGKEHARHFTYKNNPNKSHDSAQHWLDEVTSSMLTGQYVDPKAGETSLAEYFNTWEARQIWAPATRSNAKNALRHCTFKDVPLKTVRKAHVESMVKHLHDEGLAASSIRTIMRVIQMVLKAATEDRLIPIDPTIGVKLPRVARVQEMVVPTVAEVGELINAAEQPLKLLIALCAFAGLRRGEALAVQLRDFDFDAQTLHIQRQVRTAEGGGTEFNVPKSGSVRTVFVPQQLLDLVDDHLENWGVRGPDKWLFALTPKGPGRGYLEPHWRELKAELGVGDLRLHDLRHFYASGLIASRCDVVTVQRALGHADPSITLKIYSHMWETAEDLTRGASAELMAQAKIELS